MERDICIRCGGMMVNVGQEKLQLGQYGMFAGHLDQLLSGALKVDIYCCQNCKKLEFYAIEKLETADGEEGIAQVPCPYCGLLHEIDDPKCPHCGERLM